MELADFFELNVLTIHRWKVEHPAFCNAIKDGKDQADRRVVRRLYERAMGYSHPDVHISNFQGRVTRTPIVKHYPPDPTSCIFWLKNRRPEEWRERVEHSGSILLTNAEDLQMAQQRAKQREPMPPPEARH